MPEFPNVRLSCGNSNISDLLQILATEITDYLDMHLKGLPFGEDFFSAVGRDLLIVYMYKVNKATQILCRQA
jgi:hypothetical protein